MVFEVVNEVVWAHKSKKTHGSSKELLVEGHMMKLEIVIAKVQGMVDDTSNGIEELREHV